MFLIELPVGTGGGFKHEKKVNKKIGNWNTRFVNELNFLLWIDSVVILKCPKRILEYHFSKVFTLFECNTINLAKLPNELKQRIHEEDKDNYDKVMTCTITIPSTSNTLKNLTVNKSFHYSYIKIKFNYKKETIINIFSEYLEPLLKDINHP